ncbi:MAG: DUF2147 domain-containing protein [Bacteroidota bacterium]|jgi:uncharacterized protein (DUF2147 family)
MIKLIIRMLQAATVGTVTTLAAGTAFAGGSATGLWYDQSGRGAIEITNCGANLCGRLVWLKDDKNAKACGTQIIGNVKPVADGKWDGGWIYDPEDDAKYSVEITAMGDKLKVMGYQGSKFLSETMIWKRAPSELKRCSA